MGKIKDFIKNMAPAIYAGNAAYVSEVEKRTDPNPSIKRPQSYVFSQQLKRLKQDILSWRVAIDEVEQPWYPQRVRLQQLYQDTVLNGHVAACMEKRKRLTLLKDFGFYLNGKENTELTKLFRRTWFYNLMNYALDAQAYGYTLVAFGDLRDDTFPDLEIIRRYNVSPERLQIQHFIYSITGVNFMDQNIKDAYGNSIYDWTAWVSTPSESGVNRCGNGYLYKVGLYEIFLRNVLGQNGDFVELYAQPYRVGKTDKLEGPERDELERALRDMGSAGYAIIDPVDEIEFLETALGGTGYKSYESLERRCEEKVSKVILGHASAIDKTSGKLGSDDDVKEALAEVQQVDNRFFANYMNEVLIDKLRVLGFNIPFGTEFKFKNDQEEQEHVKAQNDNNKQIAEVAKIMSEAGMIMDETYFTEKTGIKFTKVAPPVPVKNNISKEIKDKLKNLYE